MRLVTWNVNSIRAREGHVRRFLEREQPDVLMLQEIKCEETAFPAAGFAELGYTAAVVGQKTYNGVAALARVPFTVRLRCLPEEREDTAEARYIEIEAGGVVMGGLYLPNGNSGGDEGYRKKLTWMDALNRHAEGLMEAETPCVLMGDFNVCPEDRDYAPGALGADDALVRLETRRRFRALTWLGFTDAVRALEPNGGAFTFWDYQGGAFARDRGMRIDHAMLSPRVAERLTAVRRFKGERAEPQPSDHVPVMVELRST